MTQPIVSLMDKLELECGERKLGDFVLLALLYLIPHYFLFSVYWFIFL